MPGLLIPNDWNENEDGFCALTITIPNSPRWKANVIGALHFLTKPGQWDADTGDPDAAAALGRTIFDSIEFDCPS